jgi:hypothetical protein
MKAEKYKYGRKWGVCFYDETGKYITTQSYTTKRTAERACENPTAYYKGNK